MKTTPLTALHQALGARMAPFAGFVMPISYRGILEEHLAVRQKVGVFDVSHMGEFLFEGPGALEDLQRLTVNDVGRLKVGRAQYNMLPNPQGGVVDDIYLYRIGEEAYLMVVNAANIEKDLAFLREQGAKPVDCSADFALLAVQGPKAALLLDALAPLDLLSPKKNETFETTLAGLSVRLARTGYTGEDGYEIFVAPEEAQTLFELLLERGAVPCGLGARDTLRLEAGFPLYGHELDETTNPLCTPMAWAVKREKEFLGKEAMLAPCAERLVGLMVEEGIPREGYEVRAEGRPVGRVTSGTLSPILNKGIALAWVEESWSEEGRDLEVVIRGKPRPARVHPLPFVHGTKVGHGRIEP